jgi:hypothetical protein
MADGEIIGRQIGALRQCIREGKHDPKTACRWPWEATHAIPVCPVSAAPRDNRGDPVQVGQERADDGRGDGECRVTYYAYGLGKISCDGFGANRSLFISPEQFCFTCRVFGGPITAYAAPSSLRC